MGRNQTSFTSATGKAAGKRGGKAFVKKYGRRRLSILGKRGAKVRTLNKSNPPKFNKE